MPINVFKNCTDYAGALIYTHRLREIRQKELNQISYSLNLLKGMFMEDVIKKKILRVTVKDIYYKIMNSLFYYKK